jgi:hypothetical protein
METANLTGNALWITGVDAPTVKNISQNVKKIQKRLLVNI